MKGSNIKSKMSRFTFSACALFFAGGMFVACEDELLTGTPSWLGSSIYDELAQRGNYQTTLKLINDPDVSVLNNDGQTEYRRLLGLTGSKTLFVADDDAYARFFESNNWGVRSYDDLSMAQKRVLFKSSMVNSAYLIELLSNQSNNTANPTVGSIMRRDTELSLYDTIPVLKADEMPDNPYWAYYRSRYPENGADGMMVMRDNTVPTMSHFITDFMRNKQITDDDLNFLTNGECTNISDAYINGRRVTERDVTCQNGYIQVVEGVMEPLPNMAEAIRKDKDLSTFSSLLDRFSVPVYNESVTNTYNQTATTPVDSIFVWRYFNDGFSSGNENNSASTNYLATYRGNGPVGLLPYDPGWNHYANVAGGASYQQDMGLIIAPTNQAFTNYFNNEGKSLMDRYKEVDNIPDNIVLYLLDNFMKTSLVATVPSKFETVVNTAQMPMGLAVEKVDSCIMTNNGVVYKMNEVLSVPEYQSVAFPAALDDGIRVMRMVIDNESLGYRGYLNSMETEYILLLPSDEALANYIDPVDFCKSRPTITEFYYDETVTSDGGNTLNRIKTRRYYAREENGKWVKGTEISNPWSIGAYSGYTELDYVRDRLQEVLENSIYVKDRELSESAGQNVWVSKGGCPVILEGTGDNLKITTPYRRELAGVQGTAEPVNVRSGGHYDMGHNPEGNGETFILDEEAVQPANKSVLSILKELAAVDSRYQEFRDLLMHSTLVSLLYDFSGSGDASVAKTVSNDTTINVMENFNYTIYVPTSEEINKLYEANILPDWRDKAALESQLEGATEDESLELEKQIAQMDTLISNFLRYHIQNNAIYLGGESRNGYFETSYMSGGRFSTLNVVYGGGEDYSITCMDENQAQIEGEEPRHVLEGNYFARDYHFRGNNSSDESIELESANQIYNYSSAVIHLIDKPLLYSKELSDQYNDATGN